ncbi:MAG: nucleotidyltransferase domain-containing protein, partial [Oscillospiraceae bacterium]|nr:nucleotidyltransferase domain-containing protein [Oscillospiraceae bacterium]
MQIEKLIQEKISEIEQTEHVRILHAVESGSRAWGFASPNSDYDVRFIYVRKKQDYLKLNPISDVINWQLDDVFDINGWDLKKTLCLLKNSNPTIFEWNLSPIVYKTTDFWQKNQDIINHYFSCKAGVYHYLNTAKTSYEKFLTLDKVKLKKYFYVLRPILACRWILKNKQPAPMLFSELVNSMLEPEMKSLIQDLLDKKINSPESSTGNPIPELNNYILRNLNLLKKEADSLCNDKNYDWNSLNQMFLD